MVYVFLADGFEEIEAVTVIDVLRRADIRVSTVGLESENVTGAHGIPILTDMTVKKMRGVDDIDMVVLPGGMPGAQNLLGSDYVYKVIKHCEANDRFIAAICAAPMVLGSKLLKGRRATCYPGFESHLRGAEIVNASVVVDKKIITAKGPGVSLDFALTLVTLLKSQEVADRIKEEMQCRT